MKNNPNIGVKEFTETLIKIGSGHSYADNWKRDVVMKIVHSNDFLILASNLKTDDLINLIKGLCVFEGLPDMQFGSTTKIPKVLNLLHSRPDSGYTELVDWLFVNRTNEYVPYGRSTPLDIKSEEDYQVFEINNAHNRRKNAELEEQRHTDAVKRKQKNQLDHLTRSDANRKLRNKKGI